MFVAAICLLCAGLFSLHAAETDRDCIAVITLARMLMGLGYITGAAVCLYLGVVMVVVP